MAFRDRLRDEIEYKGLTLKEVADQAGIPKRTLDNYVDSRAKMPSIAIAVKLAKALGVSVEYLMTDYEDDPDFHSPYKEFDEENNARIHKKKKDIIKALKKINVEIAYQLKKLHGFNFRDEFLEFNTYKELQDLLYLRTQAYNKIIKEIQALPSEGKSLLNELSEPVQYIETAAEKFYKSGTLLKNNGFETSQEAIEAKQAEARHIDLKKLLSLDIEQQKAVATLIDGFFENNEEH